jgi:hypothetical protein
MNFEYLLLPESKGKLSLMEIGFLNSQKKTPSLNKPNLFYLVGTEYVKFNKEKDFNKYSFRNIFKNP